MAIRKKDLPQIKSSGISYYDKTGKSKHDGYNVRGNENVQQLAYNLAQRLLNLSDNSAVQVLAIPIAELPNTPGANYQLTERLKKELRQSNSGDVLVIVNQPVDSIDSIRAGGFSHGLIVSPEEAQKLINGIKESPEIIDAVLQEQNQGPIQQYNEQPAKIPATQVKIFPNSEYGGEISETSTIDFPQDYEPNNVEVYQQLQQEEPDEQEEQVVVPDAIFQPQTATVDTTQIEQLKRQKEIADQANQATQERLRTRRAQDAATAERIRKFQESQTPQPQNLHPDNLSILRGDQNKSDQISTRVQTATTDIVDEIFANSKASEANNRSLNPPQPQNEKQWGFKRIVNKFRGSTEDFLNTTDVVTLADYEKDALKNIAPKIASSVGQTSLLNDAQTIIQDTRMMIEQTLSEIKDNKVRSQYFDSDNTLTTKGESVANALTNAAAASVLLEKEAAFKSELPSAILRETSREMNRAQQFTETASQQSSVLNYPQIQSTISQAIYEASNELSQLNQRGNQTTISLTDDPQSFEQKFKQKLLEKTPPESREIVESFASQIVGAATSAYLKQQNIYSAAPTYPTAPAVNNIVDTISKNLSSQGVNLSPATESSLRDATSKALQSTRYQPDQTSTDQLVSEVARNITPIIQSAGASVPNFNSPQILSSLQGALPDLIEDYKQNAAQFSQKSVIQAQAQAAFPTLEKIEKPKAIVPQLLNELKQGRNDAEMSKFFKDDLWDQTAKRVYKLDSNATPEQVEQQLQDIAILKEEPKVLLKYIKDLNQGRAGSDEIKNRLQEAAQSIKNERLVEQVIEPISNLDKLESFNKGDSRLKEKLAQSILETQPQDVKITINNTSKTLSEVKKDLETAQEALKKETESANSQAIRKNQPRDETKIDEIKKNISKINRSIVEDNPNIVNEYLVSSSTNLLNNIRNQAENEWANPADTRIINTHLSNRNGLIKQLEAAQAKGDTAAVDQIQSQILSYDKKFLTEQKDTVNLFLQPKSIHQAEKQALQDPGEITKEWQQMMREVYKVRPEEIAMQQDVDNLAILKRQPQVLQEVTDKVNRGIITQDQAKNELIEAADQLRYSYQKVIRDSQEIKYSSSDNWYDNELNLQKQFVNAANVIEGNFSPSQAKQLSQQGKPFEVDTSLAMAIGKQEFNSYLESKKKQGYTFTAEDAELLLADEMGWTNYQALKKEKGSSFDPKKEFTLFLGSNKLSKSEYQQFFTNFSQKVMTDLNNTPSNDLAPEMIRVFKEEYLKHFPKNESVLNQVVNSPEFSSTIERIKDSREVKTAFQAAAAAPYLVPLLKQQNKYDSDLGKLHKALGLPPEETPSDYQGITPFQYIRETINSGQTILLSGTLAEHAGLSQQDADTLAHDLIYRVMGGTRTVPVFDEKGNIIGQELQEYKGKLDQIKFIKPPNDFDLAFIRAMSLENKKEYFANFLSNVEKAQLAEMSPEKQEAFLDEYTELKGKKLMGARDVLFSELRNELAARNIKLSAEQLGKIRDEIHDNLTTLDKEQIIRLISQSGKGAPENKYHYAKTSIVQEAFGLLTNPRYAERKIANLPFIMYDHLADTLPFNIGGPKGFLGAAVFTPAKASKIFTTEFNYFIFKNKLEDRRSEILENLQKGIKTKKLGLYASKTEDRLRKMQKMIDQSASLQQLPFLGALVKFRENVMSRDDYQIANEILTSGDPVGTSLRLLGNYYINKGLEATGFWIKNPKTNKIVFKPLYQFQISLDEQLEFYKKLVAQSVRDYLMNQYVFRQGTRWFKKQVIGRIKLFKRITTRMSARFIKNYASKYGQKIVWGMAKSSAGKFAAHAAEILLKRVAANALKLLINFAKIAIPIAGWIIAGLSALTNLPVIKQIKQLLQLWLIATFVNKIWPLISGIWQLGSFLSGVGGAFGAAAGGFGSFAFMITTPASMLFSAPFWMYNTSINLGKALGKFWRGLFGGGGQISSAWAKFSSWFGQNLGAVGGSKVAIVVTSTSVFLGSNMAMQAALMNGPDLLTGSVATSENPLTVIKVASESKVQINDAPIKYTITVNAPACDNVLIVKDKIPEAAVFDGSVIPSYQTPLDQPIDRIEAPGFPDPATGELVWTIYLKPEFVTGPCTGSNSVGTIVPGSNIDFRNPDYLTKAEIKSFIQFTPLGRNPSLVNPTFTSVDQTVDLIYDLAHRTGNEINPMFVLAILHRETQLGATGPGMPNPTVAYRPRGAAYGCNNLGDMRIGSFSLNNGAINDRNACVFGRAGDPPDVFALFKTYEGSLTATFEVLDSYIDGGLLTLEAIADRYSPADDGSQGAVKNQEWKEIVSCSLVNKRFCRTPGVIYDTTGGVTVPSGNGSSTATSTGTPFKTELYFQVKSNAPVVNGELNACIRNTAYATIGAAPNVFTNNGTATTEVGAGTCSQLAGLPSGDIETIKASLCSTYRICPTVSLHSPPQKAGFTDWTLPELTALWNVAQKIYQSPNYVKYTVGNNFKIEVQRSHCYPLGCPPDDDTQGYNLGFNGTWATIPGAKVITITDNIWKIENNPNVLEYIYAHEIAHSAQFGRIDGVTTDDRTRNPAYNYVVACNEVVSKYGSSGEFKISENNADSLAYYVTPGETGGNYVGWSGNTQGDIKLDHPCSYNRMKGPLIIDGSDASFFGGIEYGN